MNRTSKDGFDFEHMMRGTVQEESRMEQRLEDQGVFVKLKIVQYACMYRK